MSGSGKILPHENNHRISHGRATPTPDISIDSGDVEMPAQPAVQAAEVAYLDDKSIDNLPSKLAPGSLITLKEQLQIEFLDRKRQEAQRKMLQKIEQQEEDKKLRNQIITFMYASDYTYLRRSSPDEVWDAILRREAWRQIPVTLIIVSMVQVCICAIVMIAKSAPVNYSTLIMAIMYVVAMATSNPFTISKDLTGMLTRTYHAHVQTRAQQIFFVAVCVVLSPILALVLAVAYGITAVLDFTTGPILDVSYGSMVNIIVNIIVVFSALSIGLRSDDPINAIQTFVGFDFINNLDEGIIATINVDLMAHATRSNNVSTKMLTVRLTVYILTVFILAGAFYLTLFNECYIFCQGDEIVI